VRSLVSLGVIVTALVFAQMCAAPARAKTVGGPPTFSQPKSYDNEVTGAQYVAVGDVLHRGINDLVVTHANDMYGHVTLLLGTGHGTFGPAQRVYLGTSQDQVVRADLADVNGDGKLDLVIGAVNNAGYAHISVALGDGTGHFTKTSETPTYSGPFVIGKFGPGSLPDVFVQAAYALPAMVLISDGRGGFTTALLQYGGGAGGLIAADVNHDGRLDLIGIGQSPARSLTEQLQTLFGTGGAPYFTSPRYTPPSLLETQTTGINSGITAAAGDLRGIGNTDMLVFGADSQWGISNAATVYLGRRDGSFDPPLLVPIRALRAFGSAAGIADFNGDGIQDIVMTTEGAGPTGTFMLRGVGDGTFPIELQTLLPVSPFLPHLLVADLNGDGKPDIVISDQKPNQGVWVLLNTTPVRGIKSS
jgi:hypothetical protein